MKDKIVEIIKLGLQHSTAQAFLIFSGVLVLISLSKPKELILVSFWTLFYAMIAHYLTSLRKHESLGRYAVGSDHQQSIRFTTIYISYFVWWATGVGVILLGLSRFANGWIEFFLSVNINLQYLLSFIGTGIFIAPFIMTMVWLFRMFNNKKKVEKNLTGDYELELLCKHCDSILKDKVKITQKRPIWDHPCPKCGLYELEKKIEPNIAIYKITCTCKNCDDFLDKEIEIPHGLAFENYPCPKCGVTALKK